VLAELATVTDGCRVMGVYRNETNRA
jgi:hypothetical protein